VSAVRTPSEWLPIIVLTTKYYHRRFYPHPLDQSLNNGWGVPTTRGILNCSKLLNRGGGYYIYLI